MMFWFILSVTNCLVCNDLFYIFHIFNRIKRNDVFFHFQLWFLQLNARYCLYHLMVDLITSFKRLNQTWWNWVFHVKSINRVHPLEGTCHQTIVTPSIVCASLSFIFFMYYIRRYARTDEIGIPFGVTVDFQSFKDNCVTLRERDTMEQLRIPVEEHINNDVKKLTFVFVGFWNCFSGVTACYWNNNMAKSNANLSNIHRTRFVVII